MKNVEGVIIALLALACVGSANATMFGFDAGANFYQPRDSRWSGVGVTIALNANISKDFTVGYRVEELNVKGSDSGTVLLTGVATNTVYANSQITFQGVQGWLTAARAMEDKVSADLGLWFGSANTSNFPTAVAGAAAMLNPATTAGLSSPFIEPEARVNYTSKGSVVDARFSVSGGYRFVRNWNLTPAFFTLGALTAASRNLTDFDGLDIGASFGLMF